MVAATGSLTDRRRWWAATLFAACLAGVLGGCESQPSLTFQNRTDTLITLRVSAEGGRRLEVLHKDTAREIRAGQERFATRPAAGLRGVSEDGESFGPMRVNPDEIIRFRIMEPTDLPAEPGSALLRFEATKAFAIDARDRVEIEIHPPLPELLALGQSSEGLRFELPVNYQVARQGDEQEAEPSLSAAGGEAPDDGATETGE